MVDKPYALCGWRVGEPLTITHNFEKNRKISPKYLTALLGDTIPFLVAS